MARRGTVKKKRIKQSEAGESYVLDPAARIALEILNGFTREAMQKRGPDRREYVSTKDVKGIQ